MSINLASRLSAITTDFAGVNHIVWVEENAIWHAQFDANAGTWVNAQRAVNGVTGNVTALNLVANDKLINGTSPGLAVIWQDGAFAENQSNFYYSAAQYSSTGQLQWASQATSLTVNETTSKLPFANLAPQVVADNNGNITIVGQQVNVLNSANQAIREDTDLYTSALSISSVTPTTSSTPPTAFYTPPTIVNGVNQGPGIPLNQSSNTAKSASPTNAAPMSAQETSLTGSTSVSSQAAAPSASSSSSSGSFQGLGFQFGPSLSFTTDLIDALGLNEYLFGIPRLTIDRTLKQYELVGTLSGTTNFSSGIELVSDGEATRYKGIEAIYKNPWEVRPTGYERKEEESITFAYESTSTYENTSPYYLGSIEDFLSLSDVDTIDLLNKPEGLIAGTIDLIGSLGIGVKLTLEPINPSESDSLLSVISYDVAAGLSSVLLTGVATQLFGDQNDLAAAMIASAIFTPIEDLLIGNLTDASNLKVSEFLVGPSLGLKVEGQFFTDLFPILKLNASGGVTLFFGIGEDGVLDTTLGIPLSIGVGLGEHGPLQVNLSIDPSWTWTAFAVSSDTTTSAATASNFAPSSVAVSASSATTATVTGSLLTLNFDAPLDTSSVPDPSDFTLSVSTVNPNALTPTVGGVLVNNDPTTGNGVVVLQLSQPIAYSPQFTGTNPQSNGEAAITVSYTGTALEYSDNTAVSDFSDLSVTNNSPQSLAVSFNPTSGNGNDYTVGNQTAFLDNLEADYAQDSPPAIALVTTSSTSEGQVLAVWSREVQPLTPIAGFVNGDQAYLNFVQALNTSSTPSNSQFTVSVNNTTNSVSVTNVAIAAGGYIQLNLSQAVASSDVVSITYQPSTTNQIDNLYLTDAANDSQLWIPSFSESLTNTTDQNQSAAPTTLGGAAIIDNSSTNNLITLIFDSFLSSSNIPNSSQFTVLNNGQTYSETISNIAVNGNTVTFNLPAPANTPLISQGDIVSVTYTPNSQGDQNLISNNGTAVGTFTTQLTTVPETPTTTLMAGFYTPGGTAGLTNFQNIPGTEGLNFDPAVATDTSGNALAVWVYADTSDIDNLAFPGQFYTDDQSQIILDDLNQSDIYFSYWNGSEWLIAAPLATNQPGTDASVTVSYDSSSGTYIAAWLNTNNSDTTIYWASYNPSQQAWSAVGQVLSEATPDPLTELVIGSVNNQPTLFWTETQPVSYSQLTQQENPSIYLRLGELSGTTAKNSGNLGYAANGVYNDNGGTVTLKEAGALYNPTTQSGDPNRAALFEQGASVTLNSALNTSGSAFSVEFWFKIPSAVSSTTNLVDLAGIFSVVLNDDGTLTFGLDNSSSITTSTTTNPFVTDTWYYVVGTYSNQNQELSLYLNGQPVQTLDNVSFTLPANATLTLAGGTDAVYLDEVALYGNALSYSAQPTSGQNITGLNVLDTMFGTDQIGEKYSTQYVDPLPPGPQTHYSTLGTPNLAYNVGTAESSASPNLLNNNGVFYLAYIGEGSNQIYLTTSSNSGQTWANPVELPSVITSNQSPSLAFYQGTLYLAYVGLNNEIYITSSNNNGSQGSWSTPYSLGQSSTAGVSLGISQNQLVAFFVNSDSYVQYAFSGNPQSSSSWLVDDTLVSQVDSAISATNLNNTLYLASQGSNGGYSLLASESAQNSSIGDTSSASPMLVSDNIGNVYVAYLEEEGGQIYVATSNDQGQTWTNPVAALPSGVTSSQSPALAFYGDDLYLAYVGANNEIFLIYSDNLGQSWSTTPLSLGQSSSGGVSLSSYQGELVVFFVGSEAGSNTESNIEYIFSSNPQVASTWSTSYSIPNQSTGDTVSAGDAVSATVFNNNLYVAYQGVGNSEDNYVLATGYLEPLVTNIAENAKSSPALINNDDTFYLAYGTPQGEIYLTTSSNSGKSWEKPVALPSSVTSSQSPALVFYGDDLYLAYIDDAQIYLTYSSNNGTTWSTPYSLQNVSPSTSGGVSLSVQQDGVQQDQLVVFYTDNKNAIQYSYSSDPQNSSSWSEPDSITVGGKPASTTAPVSTTVLNGTIYLAYQEGEVEEGDQYFYYVISGSIGGPWTQMASTLVSNQTTAPSLTNDGNQLYLTYGDNGTLFYSTSIDGNSWSSTNAVSNIEETNLTPASVAINGELFIGYTSTQDSVDLVSNFQLTNLNWSSSVIEGITNANTDPNITNNGNQMYLLYGDSSNQLNYLTSTNGSDWSNIFTVEGAENSGLAPSGTVSGGILYLGYTASSDSEINVISGFDLASLRWTQTDINNVTNGETAPGLTNDGNQLYLTYASKNGALSYLTSSDGTSWSNANSLGQTSTNSPSPTILDGLLYLSYVDSKGDVYVATSVATWDSQTSITPIPFIQPTQLSDANSPVVDVVSNTTPNSTGNIYPNGQQDTIFKTTLTTYQGKTISGISLTLSNGSTYSVGAGGSTTDNQLGVVIGDSLINSPAANATFTYPVMGASLTLDLLVDTGSAPSASITVSSVTVTFTNGTTVSSNSSTQSPYLTLPTFVPPNSVPATPGNVSVLGTATVTETNDSSLALIDSGFVINTTNPGMGYAVVSADFNNDGISDVAVGNRGYSLVNTSNNTSTVVNQGTVQILLGGQSVLSDSSTSSLAPPTTNDSSSSTSGNVGGFAIVGIPDEGQTNGQFPLSMATGDVNNDGYADLVIGSPNNSTVYVIYGSYLASSSPETVINVQSLTSSQGYLITSPNGTTSGDLFGFAVAVGNFDGTAGADIAIGAPNASNGQGEVFVAYNGSTLTSGSTAFYTGSSYTDSSTGDTIGEQAGYALAASSYQSGGASTFSGSSTTDDLIIGAPSHTIAVNNTWTGLGGLPTNNPSPYPNSTPVNVGAVYVFTSSSSGLASSPSYTYLGTDADTPSANGAAQSLYAGSAVASNGDWDGDGYLDLAIAAPGGNSNEGVVYLLNGGNTATTSSTQYLNQVSDLTINGGLPSGQAGTVVTSAGDVNDDGYTDLLITAPQGANGTGQGYVVFGQSDLLGTTTTPATLDLNVTASDNKATFLLNGNFPYQLTGQAASPIGDINGDGVDDLMTTAPNANQLYAVYGHPWLADEGSVKLADISGDNGFVIDGDLYSVEVETLIENVGEQAPNAPSLISNNGILYLAFQGQNDNNIYFTTSSDGGQTWASVSQLSSDFQTDSPPALAFYDGDLYLAYLGNGNNELNFIYSSDNGQSWSSSSITLSNQTSGAGVSLVEYQDNLMAFFVSSDNSNSGILYVYSDNPSSSSSWSTDYAIANQTSSNIVSPTVLNDTLYLAYSGGKVGSGSNYYVTSTTGTTLSSLSWSATEVSNATNPNTAPGLTNDGTQLYLTYGSSETNNPLYYLTSSNGSSWSDLNAISNQTSDFLPSSTILYDILYVGYTGGNSDVYVTRVGTDLLLSGAGNEVIMLGDINGDGFADVLAGGSINGAVVTFGASTKDLLDAATGTDELVINITNFVSIQSVGAAGDFNGDGLADFGVVDQNNNFYLILGNADLGSQQTLTLSTSTNTYKNGITAAVAVGDYNSDGYDDLLLSSSNGGQTLYKGNSSGTLNSSVVFVTNSNTVFNAIGDVNGDGYGDIGGGQPNGNVISPNGTGNGQATVYSGNGSAGSDSSNSINITPPSAVISGTLNSSGKWNFNSLDDTPYASPSFAVFNGYLYMVYNSSDTLYMQRSADGYNWEGNTSLGSSFESYGQASLAVFNNTLYLAFTAKNNQVIVTPATTDSSSDLGLSFDSSNSVNAGSNTSNIGPTLAVYNDELYLFFAEASSNNDFTDILYITSSDGSTWSSNSNITVSGTNQVTNNTLGVAVDGDNLLVSFVSESEDNIPAPINVATYDGTSWNSNEVDQSSYPDNGTNLLSVGDTLYLFFIAADSTDRILYITSTDGGSTWSGNTIITDQANGDDQTAFGNLSPVFFQESILLGYLTTGKTDIGIATSNPIYEPNQTQQFGEQLQNIGDFNGDGIADLGVLAPGFFSNLGSWNNNLLENNQGAVLIYYGTTAGITDTASPDVVLGTPAPTSSTSTANNQAILLSNFSGAGDINGDGYDDLIIASPNTALNSNNTTDGLALVVFGGGESLWDSTYLATSPFNLGNLTPDTSQLTLYFSSPLNTANVPATSAFTVQSGTSPITVSSIAFNNPNELTLTLDSNANTSDFLSVAYVPPSSGALTYEAGTSVTQFTASNDAVIATLGAPIIEIQTYPQYGFSITGLPYSQAGISLDGGGDVNGDGFSDFIIGAPGDNDNLTYTLFGSDFNNTVNQTGTIGEDVMKGSPTGESFVASQGNDLIVTGGGTDVVYAGPGDDQVIVNDTYFRRLDGGTGLDVLFFQGYNGQDWDLTTLSPGMRLRDFEILVAENYGANTLTLNSLSVTQLSPTNTLTLILDEADSLVLSNDFSYEGTVYQYNSNFLQYQSSTSAAKILVNQPNVWVSLTAPNSNTPDPILPTGNNATVASAALLANNVESEDFVTRANNADANGVSDAVSDNNVPTQIYVSNPTVSEGKGRADFTLTRTGDLNQYVWVDYYTQDGDAKAGNRYTPVAGQAVFAPGESTLTVTVPIPNNGQYVGSRQFGLAVTVEGESTNAADVPDAWNTAISTPKEQIRRWTLVPGEDSNSVVFDITSNHSPNRIVTMDMTLDGKVVPLIWNTTTQAYENLPFNNVNGITQFQDINGDVVNDLYRLNFQDGGPFDGDTKVNGLITLDFTLVQLDPIDVPATGGSIQGTQGNDYLSAQATSGTNRLEGLGGIDVLVGSPQRDVLLGGADNDQLFGYGGVDKLFGDAGDDILDGGKDPNFLYGGTGADNFVLRAGDGPNRVMDFNAADGDLFLLDNISFGNLSFNNNQILLGSDILAIAIDATGQPVKDFANHPQWFVTI